MKLIYIGLIFILIFILSPNFVLAKNGCYEKPTISQKSVLYLFKRGYEKLRLRLDNKSEFQSSLLEKRLNELMYVADEGQIRFLEEASSRVTTQVGVIIDNEYQKGVSEDMIRSAGRCINDIQNNYKYESAQWLLLQYAEDMLNNIHSND